MWYTLGGVRPIDSIPFETTFIPMPPHGQIKDQTIPSRAVGRPMRVQVYLPPRYDDFNMRYPLVILLHPWGEDETFWTACLNLHELADHLINTGSVPPFIAAMPQGDKSFFIDAANPTTPLPTPALAVSTAPLTSAPTQ